jgi:hypothetical protein
MYSRWQIDVSFWKQNIREKNFILKFQTKTSEVHDFDSKYLIETKTSV